MGVSPKTYSDAQIEQMRESSTEQITIDGTTHSRYEWSKVMRKMETQMRYARDDYLTFKASGDDTGAGDARKSIYGMMEAYNAVAKAAKLPVDYSRTWLDRLNGNSGGGSTLTINKQNDRIETVPRTVGASSPNKPSVENPLTKEALRFVPNSRIIYPKDRIMAGRGCKTGRQIDEIERLVETYNTDDWQKWKKEKGFYWVYDETGGERQVELHWYDHPDTGRVEYKVKLRNGVIYLDEQED